MKAKKIFTLAMAAVLTLALLAGCGAAAPAADPTAAPATDAPAADAPATEASASEAPAALSGRSAGAVWSLPLTLFLRFIASAPAYCRSRS